MTQHAATSGGYPAAYKTVVGDDAWMSGPRRPRLAAGAVHVWRADLSAVSDEVLHSLSPEERERAARFPHERDALRWARARGVLRAVLGRYLEVEPASVRFQLDAHGKPSLALPGRKPRLSFNISHSGALALYAFTRAASVGIDVQALRRRPIDEIAIARRAFGAAESARLRELKPPARRREFLRLWVRREAGLKCIGTGLGGSDSYRASQGPHCARPWLAELDVKPWAAAVACPESPRELRCWEWQAGGISGGRGAASLPARES